MDRCDKFLTFCLYFLAVAIFLWTVAILVILFGYFVPTIIRLITV